MNLLTLVSVLLLLSSLTLKKLPFHMKFFFNRKRKASRDLLSPREMIEQTSRLLNLPDEILINIVGHLEYEDLLVARAVSTHLQALAEPHIYEGYKISHGRKSKRLATLIEANPKRASWLKSVLVSTRYEEDRGLWLFPDQLRQMRNLQHLVLETPDCNSKLPADRVTWVVLQEKYESILKQSTIDIPMEERVLGKLETCTMHLVDAKQSLYLLPKYSSIFLHPTLKSLRLSCACTDYPERLLTHYRRYKRSTALEHLHLEECDVDPRSLELLLKFPKGLKSLKLSEGTRYDTSHSSRSVRIHGNLMPGTLASALTRSVGDTLETLHLHLGFRIKSAFSINLPGRALDLRSMTRLTNLSLHWDTLCLVKTRPMCDHEVYRRLPPSITTLEVFGIPLIALQDGPVVPLNACVFKHKAAHGLPILKTVVYRYEYQTANGRSSRGLITRPNADLLNEVISAYMDALHKINDRKCRLYKKSGVRVIVEMEATPPGFIPPYLDNEEHPVVDTFWDSDDIHYEVEQVQDGEASTSRGQGPDSNEDEENDPVEIMVRGRRLSELAHHYEGLLNMVIMQPGHGLPL